MSTNEAHEAHEAHEVPVEPFDSAMLDLSQLSLTEILSSSDSALSLAVSRIVDNLDRDGYDFAGFGNRI